MLEDLPTYSCATYGVGTSVLHLAKPTGNEMDHTVEEDLKISFRKGILLPLICIV